MAKLTQVQGNRYQYRGDTVPMSDSYPRPSDTIDNIAVHHTACCGQYVEQSDVLTMLNSINTNHKARLHPLPNRFGNHIAYHYICTRDMIIETRPTDQMGYHAGDYSFNDTGIGICLLGDFTTISPSEAEYECIAGLIREIRKDSDAPIYMHRDIKATSCPGDKFDSNKLFRTVTGTTVDDCKIKLDKIKDILQ